jgi:hypothetical protein
MFLSFGASKLRWSCDMTRVTMPLRPRRSRALGRTRATEAGFTQINRGGPTGLPQSVFGAESQCGLDLSTSDVSVVHPRPGLDGSTQVSHCASPRASGSTRCLRGQSFELLPKASCRPLNKCNDPNDRVTTRRLQRPFRVDTVSAGDSLEGDGVRRRTRLRS